jgi:hypothetical protein
MQALTDRVELNLTIGIMMLFSHLLAFLAGEGFKSNSLACGEYIKQQVFIVQGLLIFPYLCKNNIKHKSR